MLPAQIERIIKASTVTSSRFFRVFIEMDEPSLNTTTASPPPQSPSSSDQSSSVTSPGYIWTLPNLEPEMDESMELENPEAALCSLKQKSDSVRYYNERFHRIVRRIEDVLPPKFLLNVYINGLNEEIRSRVRMAPPEDITSAYHMAGDFELETEYCEPQKPRLMGVDGFLSGKKLDVVMCDVSDYSFIQPYVVSELGDNRCNVQQVMLDIDGGQVVRMKGCRNLGLKLGSHKFKEDFFVRGMLGCDMILGRTWLTRWKEATVLKNGKMEYVFDDGVTYELQWKVVVNASDIIGTLTSTISHSLW